MRSQLRWSEFLPEPSRKEAAAAAATAAAGAAAAADDDGKEFRSLVSIILQVCRVCALPIVWVFVCFLLHDEALHLKHVLPFA